MKTRDLWNAKILPRLDLAASGIGLAVFAYGIFAILQNWGAYVGESGSGFILWTVCILIMIGAPLAYMFYDSFRILGGKKNFVFDPQKIQQLIEFQSKKGPPCLYACSMPAAP
jgi:hypothetical protein